MRRCATDANTRYIGGVAISRTRIEIEFRIHTLFTCHMNSPRRITHTYSRVHVIREKGLQEKLFSWLQHGCIQAGRGAEGYSALTTYRISAKVRQLFVLTPCTTVTIACNYFL